MPAPVPIRIRHNDPATLAAAARGVGEGQRASEREARSWDAALRVQQLNQAVRQMDLTQRAQQDRLQLDYAKLDQQSRLRGREQDFRERMATQQRESALASPSAVSSPMGGTSPMAAAKAAYLQNVAAGLPEHERRALEIMAVTPDVDMNQLRVATSEAERRARRQSGQLDPQKRTVMEVRNVEGKIKDLQREAAGLADRLEEAGFNPQGPPSQFNPQTRDVPSGFIGNITEFYAGGDVEEGGSRDALQTYTAMAKRLRQIEDLRQQRMQLLNQGVPAGSTEANARIPAPRAQVAPDTPTDDMAGWSIQRID